MSVTTETEIAPDACEAVDVPWKTHRWNFWVYGTEAALYTSGMSLMGPMALFPFLFQQTGINGAFLGLFTASNLIMALGGPVGSALAGGRQWKLSFCLRVGLFQRLPFLIVPLGVALLYGQPAVLLTLLVLGWTVSNFFTGVITPVYQTVLTNSVREQWWGRMMALRSTLAATAGLLATGLVWGVNKGFAFPTNYTLLGVCGVAMVFASLYVVSRLREIPLREDRTFGRATVRVETRKIVELLSTDRHVRWLVCAYVARSCGFFLGTYCTAVFIERCHLTDSQMWIPVILGSVPTIFANLVSGWIVDRFGARLALVASATLVAGNSIFVTYCDSMWMFLIFFPSIAFGGSLLMNGWPTLLMKMASPDRRPLYFSTVSLVAAPGSIAVSIIGILLVRFGGYDAAFYLAAAGGLLAALLFQFRLPNVRQSAS